MKDGNLESIITLDVDADEICGQNYGEIYHSSSDPVYGVAKTEQKINNRI